MDDRFPLPAVADWKPPRPATGPGKTPDYTVTTDHLPVSGGVLLRTVAVGLSPGRPVSVHTVFVPDLPPMSRI